MRKFLFVLMAVFAATFAFASVAKAATFQGENNPNISQSETVKNAYLAGNSVNFAGKATQDLVAAGNNLNIAGEVGDNLNLAGNIINVEGPIGKSVRALGANITIQNSVGSDLIIAGGTLDLTQNATVGDDLMAAGGIINLAGKVLGNAHISGGQVYLNGQVNGNVQIKGANKVTLGNDAVINGNFSYEAAAAATISPNAKIAGETNFTKIESRQTSTSMWDLSWKKIAGAVTLFSIGVLIVMFLTIWFLTFLFPKLTRKLVENGLAKPWENMGVGFLYLIAVPIAGMIIFATLIGIPLGLLAFGLYIFTLILARLIAPIFIGALLFKWFGKKEAYRIDWLTILVGIVVSTIIGLVPFLGPLALFLIFLIALAQIFKTILNFIKTERN